VSPARRDPADPEAEANPATLEQVLEQLEETVRRLSDQSAPLGRLVADWERAQVLAADAERRLDEAERGLRPAPGGRRGAEGGPGRSGPGA
jgi:exodeoxyribonuclease VII small subunit